MITLWNSLQHDGMDATSLEAVEGQLEKHLEEIDDTLRAAKEEDTTADLGSQ